MRADLLLRGGTVYDGTGAAPRSVDVAVTDGRVSVLDHAGAMEAERVEDVSGLAVAPGFIDIHTHSDLSVLLDGRAQSKIHQGVTTEVTGNCGFSPFPLAPDRLALHQELLAGIGDDRVDLTWTDVDGYARVIEQRGTAINIAPLVGHGTLRIAVMGVDDRAATRPELETMRSLLTQMLEQGAFGLSTGLTYVPSRSASTSELADLCRTLAAHGRLYATHARDDSANDPFSSVDETLRLGRETGVAVQFSHAAINNPTQWGTAHEWVARFEAACDDGIDGGFDIYPYDASSSSLTQYLPAWVQEGGVDAMRARLADPSTMARAEAELAEGWSAARIPWSWDRVVLARTDGILGAVEGWTVERAAGEAGVSEPHYVLELCREGGNRIQVVLFSRTEDDMRTFLRSDRALVGSDGAALPFDLGGRRPHPRAFGAHARVLGRYVRELADLNLSAAIARMTGAVAQRLSMDDRGTIAVGKVADLVVFDPRTIVDRASYLDPGQPPTGVVHVLVNGVFVIDSGEEKSARPGKVLRA